MTVGIYEFYGNCFPCNKKSFSFPYLLTHIILTLPVSRTIGIHLQLRNGLHQIVKTALFVQYGYILLLLISYILLTPLTHGYNRDALLLISDFPHLQRHISIFRLRYKRESRCISNSWWIELSCISVEQYFFTMHLYCIVYKFSPQVFLLPSSPHMFQLDKLDQFGPGLDTSEPRISSRP